MREISHSDEWAELPARKPRPGDPFLADLPWMRRERADANIRHAIGDLRALALEDPGWTRQYQTLADCFESALELINAIEDVGFAEQFSIKVQPA